ncbi:MAG: c-type cytochrome [Gammaproteobacteria bacterium]
MALHDDRTFVRHFSWVILALAAITIIFIVISFVVVAVSGITDHNGYSYVQYLKKHPGAVAPGSAAKAQAAAPTKPGMVAKAEQSVPSSATGSAAAVVAANAGGKNTGGQAIWKAHCSVCHATGAAGAPRIGDKKAWAPILAKTPVPTLYKRAINGYKGPRGFMPPKGGASSLSDAQVKSAAIYMIIKSGGPKPSAATKPGGGAKAGAGAKKTASVAAGLNGKSIWQAHCSVCHATGVAGAPKIGDKKAWAPILAKTNMALLFEHAIKGFKGNRGFMPPKGGASNLSDDQVKAAVKYMVDRSGEKSGG